MEANKLYEIDDKKTFEENLSSFGSIIISHDELLGQTLEKNLNAISDQAITKEEVWTLLMAALEPPKAEE